MYVANAIVLRLGELGNSADRTEERTELEVCCRGFGYQNL